MLVFLLLSLNGCLTLGDTLNPDGDDVLWPDDCDNTDPKILDAERTRSYLDKDGDGFGDSLNYVEGCETPSGYVSDASDCDDDNAMIHPNMPELCGDGIDQDCDDKIDDDDSYLDEDSTKLFYADQDGDGFGDPENTSQRCESSAEWLSDNTDCDDTDANVNPNSIEECDEQDNNCDGRVDENTINKQQRYIDLDGDDFGDPDGLTLVCPGLEEGTTTKFRATDCDDDNYEVNPEADEICDGTDNNCDGGIDTNPTNGNLYYTDSDRDGFGNADSIVYSCKSTPPFRTSDNPDDCDDGDGSSFPDAAETCGDAIVNDCNARVAEADGGISNARADCPIGTDTLANAQIKFVGPMSGERAGGSIAGVGDIDGDGNSDLLIGAVGYGTPDTGGAYLFFGSGTLSGQVSLSTSDHAFAAEDEGDEGGGAVAFVQDWDNDGRPEILIGAHSNDEIGAVYLIMSSAMPAGREFSLSRRVIKFIGEDFNYHISRCISDAGDVNGDGVSDLLMGSGLEYSDFTYSISLSGTGAYLVYGDGSYSGENLLDEMGMRFDRDGSTHVAGAVGIALSTAGDLDGDGCSEFLVSAPLGTDKYGYIFLFKGCRSFSDDLADADTVLNGTQAFDFSGLSVQGGVDIDGDGSSELLIGAPWLDGTGLTSSGAMFVVQGNDAISHSTYNLSSSSLAIEGIHDGSRTGFKVSFAGDLNGDGLPDIMTSTSPSSGASGATYVFISPGTLSGVIGVDQANITLTGEATGDEAGYSIAGIGDFDGDGLDDLAIGAPGDNTMGSESGAVYVLSGASLFDY